MELAVQTVRMGRLDQSLGFRLRLAQLHVFAAFAEAAATHEVTPSQFAVLLLIEANPGIKQIELASAVALDRSTMVRLVDRCEAAKLVRRGSSKDDRRAAPLALTSRGRALVEKLEPAVSRREAAASGLSRAERTTLVTLLERISSPERQGESS